AILSSTLFPYTTLFRSRQTFSHRRDRRIGGSKQRRVVRLSPGVRESARSRSGYLVAGRGAGRWRVPVAASAGAGTRTGELAGARSEEHTSELQSPDHLV